MTESDDDNDRECRRAKALLNCPRLTILRLSKGSVATERTLAIVRLADLRVKVEYEQSFNFLSN